MENGYTPDANTIKKLEKAIKAIIKKIAKRSFQNLNFFSFIFKFWLIKASKAKSIIYGKTRLDRNGWRGHRNSS